MKLCFSKRSKGWSSSAILENVAAFEFAPLFSANPVENSLGVLDLWVSIQDGINLSGMALEVADQHRRLIHVAPVNFLPVSFSCGQPKKMNDQAKPDTV